MGLSVSQVSIYTGISYVDLRKLEAGVHIHATKDQLKRLSSYLMIPSFDLRKLLPLQAVASPEDTPEPIPKGYHLSTIPKGVLGEISKLEEELAEVKDALAQDNRIMVLTELSDLYGALKAFAANQGATMDELEKMATATARAFKSGRRS